MRADGSVATPVAVPAESRNHRLKSHNLSGITRSTLNRTAIWNHMPIIQTCFGITGYEPGLGGCTTPRTTLKTEMMRVNRQGGFGVQGLGFRLQGSGFRDKGLRFKFQS